MNIELNEKEVGNFLKMVYLGNKIIQDAESSAEIKTHSTYLLDLILTEYVKMRILSEEEQKINTEREIGELEEELFNDTINLLENYARQAAPYAVARIVAERVMSYKDGDVDALEKCLVAQELFEDEIDKYGEAIIQIDMPDFENQFMKRWEAGSVYKL